MIKTVKNIRKLYNAKLLFITSDDAIMQVVGSEFEEIGRAHV